MQLSRQIAIYAPLIALAALAVLVAVLLRYRRLVNEGRQVQARRLALATLATWLLVMLAGTLSGGRAAGGMPFNLRPFAMDGPISAVAGEWLLNVTLFVPLGILLPLVLVGHRVWMTVAVAALLSLAVELTQFAFQLERDATVTDIICNTVGALLGSLASRGLQRRGIPPSDARPSSTVQGPRERL